MAGVPRQEIAASGRAAQDVAGVSDRDPVLYCIPKDPEIMRMAELGPSVLRRLSPHSPIAVRGSARVEAPSLSEEVCHF